MNAGLCDRCVHQKLIQNTRGSTFSMCKHPELPKYPRLPVVRCGGHDAEGTPPRASGTRA